MEMFLTPLPMVHIFCNLFVLRECSNVDDFNNRNLFLTAKFLNQDFRYHKIRKAFSKFYHRHSELITKYNIDLKTLLQQGISEHIFYGDTVYKFKRIVGKPYSSDQLKNIIKRYKTMDITCISCASLHVWLSTQSRFIAMLHDGESGLRLNDGSDVKV